MFESKRRNTKTEAHDPFTSYPQVLTECLTVYVHICSDAHEEIQTQYAVFHITCKLKGKFTQINIQPF